MNTLKRVFNKYFLFGMALFILFIWFVLPMVGIDISDWSTAERMMFGFVNGIILSIWANRQMEKEKIRKEFEDFRKNN